MMCVLCRSASRVQHMVPVLFCTVAFLLFCTAALVDAFKLPDTGQTKCYQGVSPYAEILCAGTGQDGEYNINPMSFTDHSNGTVTDNNTGLMWQKCSVGQNNDATCSGDDVGYNWYRAIGTYDATYNPLSQNVCSSLTLGGYSDWRLPSKKELLSIVDYSIPYPGPAIDLNYFPNTIASGYLSSTTIAYYPDSAWVVSFYDGRASDGNKGTYGGSIRCVRGGQLDFGNFVDNHDGTVTDNSTALMWQQGEPGAMIWQAGLNYCENLDLADKTDWRLPNRKELESISDDNKDKLAIDITLFPNAHEAYYWSSTSVASNPNAAWAVSFYDSGFSSFTKGTLNVRCVRGGANGPPPNPVNGTCGTSNGGTFTSAPTTNLCSAGTPSTVSGSGPWTWNCTGSNGGTTANCSANIQTWTVSTSAGSGGTISPASRTVNHGATTTFTVTPNSGNGASVTGCGGSLNGNIYTTGAITANCTVTASFSPIVNGTCGTSHGGTYTTAPASNLCSTGSASGVTTNTGNYTWNCAGSNGGTTANCSATRAYTITPSAGTGGSISPNTAQTAAYNQTKQFTVIPNAGYKAIMGGTCGGSLSGNTYTTNAITTNCTVSASFTITNAMSMVVLGSDSGIWASTFDGKGEFNNDWQKLTGSTTDAPAIAWNPAANKMQLVVRGTDNRVWSSTFNAAGAFNNDWVQLTGSIPSSPALAWNPAANRMQLVVRGTDNRVWSSTFNAAGAFNNDWVQLTGSTPSPVGLATGYVP